MMKQVYKDVLEFVPNIRDEDGMQIWMEKILLVLNKQNNELIKLRDHNFFGNCDNCNPEYCCSGHECGCMSQPIAYRSTKKCKRSCGVRLDEEHHAMLTCLKKISEYIPRENDPAGEGSYRVILASSCLEDLGYE